MNYDLVRSRVCCAESVSARRCRPSAPGLPLGSTPGQAVRPLPGVAHESERLAAALLERRIQHLSVGEVDL